MMLYFFYFYILDLYFSYYHFLFSSWYLHHISEYFVPTTTLVELISLIMYMYMYIMHNQYSLYKTSSYSHSYTCTNVFCDENLFIHDINVNAIWIINEMSFKTGWFFHVILKNGTLLNSIWQPIEIMENCLVEYKMV